MGQRILYAPGLGKDFTVLTHFREFLKQEGYTILPVDFDYDQGEFAPLTYDCITANSCDWWIGISLGASLLYYLIDYVPEELRPKRLTVINPFSDRYQLSLEKGFVLGNQWNFAPIQAVCKVPYLELVASLEDVSIPSYHGRKLLNKAQAETKALVTVASGHQISEAEAQLELAHLLLSGNKEDLNYGQSKYCHFYQR